MSAAASSTRSGEGGSRDLLLQTPCIDEPDPDLAQLNRDLLQLGRDNHPRETFNDVPARDLEQPRHDNGFQEFFKRSREPDNDSQEPDNDSREPDNGLQETYSNAPARDLDQPARDLNLQGRDLDQLARDLDQLARDPALPTHDNGLQGSFKGSSEADNGLQKTFNTA